MLNRYVHQVFVFFFVTLVIFDSFAQEETSVNVMSQTNTEIVASQQNIDQISNKTREMLKEYLALQQQTDYQRFYQYQLQQLKQEQQASLIQLNKQLRSLDEIEIAMLPLMQAMHETLVQFVKLDLPFKQEDRLESLAELKQIIQSASLSLPEKYRAVLDAWSAEADYGRSIDTWRGNIKYGDTTLSGEFLRIGRVSLYFRVNTYSPAYFWDKSAQQWRLMPASSINMIRRGFDVAAERLAPELLHLPIAIEGGDEGGAR